MFAFTEKYNTALKILLGLIGLSFVGFGVSSYSDGDQADDLAKVDGESITRRDLARRMTDRQLSADEQRQLLEAVIAERLRVVHARKLGLAVSDTQLAKRIASEPGFQESGRFSAQAYERFLQARQMSSKQLESQIRQDMVVQQLALSTFGTSFVPDASLDRYAALFSEQRTVASVSLTRDGYRNQVQLAADASRQYYDKHTAEFRLPEQVRIEYLAFSAAQLADKIQLSEADVQRYFEDHKAALTAEQRKVRHILFAVAQGASVQERSSAKAKADAVLQQLRQTPSRFADLARQHSQDPGSAPQGGDLGLVSKGLMVKPFEEAMFSLKKGEISSLVETQYGYHIVLLEDIRQQGFDDVRGQIESQLRSQKAAQQFQAQSEKFADVLYQQADSLQPAAKEFGLTVAQSGWIARNKASEPLLNQPKLLEAVFAEDVLKKKHNSEPVDVGSGTLVAARVIEHRPAAVRPFSEVQGDIANKLIADQAHKLALADGQAKLAELQAGKPVALSWAAPVQASRFNAQGLSSEAIRAVFRVPAQQLPAYVGLASDSGYTLYRMDAISAETLPPERRVQLQQLIARSRMESEAKAYLGKVAGAYKVELNNKILAKIQ